MAEQGYYHSPTIHQDTIVFVSEDDLWTVPASGGLARRLTANPGRLGSPALSPDGETVAFTGRDEGSDEVYVMSAAGGPLTRRTFLGSDTRVGGWLPDGSGIVFATNARSPFARQLWLFSISPQGGPLELLDTGPAASVSFGPGGGRVIGRKTTDISRWKRYRGGLTGELWVDPDGAGDWRKLIETGGNVALPLWLKGRIYFVSDHEGVGNLYSCTGSGEDLRRHTHHEDFYVRHPSTDGRRIVYHAGGDLYLFDPDGGDVRKIELSFRSPRAERNRKFVSASEYLQGYALDPKGRRVALTSRGKAFVMGNWEGAAVQLGHEQGGRKRLVTWLRGGTRLVLLDDTGGEEVLRVYPAPGEGNPLLPVDQQTAPDSFEDGTVLDGHDIGRPLVMVASPVADQLALVNHRNELVFIDIESRTTRVLDKSSFGPIDGPAWSPDGRWLAYGYPGTRVTSCIKLCNLESGEIAEATRPVLWDSRPFFDPEGRYLYFISHREFDPVYDGLHLDLGFPKGSKPYLITLQAGTRSPFVPLLQEDADAEPQAKPEEGTAGSPEPVVIDLDGITDRLAAFPVDEGRYGRVLGIKGKVLFSSFPVEGALAQDWFGAEAPPAKGKLECYDFVERSHETLIEGITDFGLSLDGSTMAYRAGNRLRVLEAGKKPPEDAKDEPNRKSGWLDLDRPKVAVVPAAEWAQMFREAWRLQRDRFWTPDMSGVDWQAIHDRYLPLLQRVGTRSEFSDLLWEMQGELGTSHAYEIGGDYRAEPRYPQGFLGAEFAFDAATGGYELVRILRGDVWSEKAGSPLAGPGVNVRPGDLLVSVGGQRLRRDLPPEASLVHQAGGEVMLGILPAEGGPMRNVVVRVLESERPARYREWVEANRRFVHRATGGRAGYLHIPDMGPYGYAEFHRGFLAEAERDALVVDVRFNGGGHVSELLLEKLARRRLGYDIQRWGEPSPYPSLSILGPMVALTNEFAGSDGDIFSHAFKMLGLGPLIGKRTWGGVIGISGLDRLQDGGITTQPEFSFWFEDVGFGVENYGTDPTIEVEISPQDFVAGRDAQLARAIAEIERMLSEQQPRQPDFGPRPRLAQPALPKR